MKLRVILLLFVAALLPSPASGREAVTRFGAESIGSSTSWSGVVVVERPLRVDKGVTLTIKPGSEVRFRKGAGLSVEGVLKAEGKKGALITFTSDDPSPAAGDWSGIGFNEAGDGTVLRHCRIKYAGAVSVAVCSPTIQDCEILSGGQGIVLARKASPAIKGNTIRDMSGGGIHCQMGSSPLISGNTVERCGQFGIVSGQESHPAIKGNTVTGCDVGISLSQALPPVEDNVLRGNKFGIMVSYAGPDLVVRGNRVVGNESGIVCQQFASPVIEKSEITSNKEGIVCFRASSPLIRKNDVSKNEVGISCIQLCNPRITANNIHDNKRGVYLDLSSYAVINGNNIHANEMHVELGNMSSDWEYRVNKKPTRGGQAQNATMAGRGKAVLGQVDDGSEIMGYVDATGNWWGGQTTEEMDTKGPDADIKGFKDYYDVPTRTYEGYSGIYAQDRIKYQGWKKARIKDAGI